MRGLLIFLPLAYFWACFVCCCRGRVDRRVVFPYDHARVYLHFLLIDQHRVKRFIFDVSYWVLVPLLLLNMVSGVILDR